MLIIVIGLLVISIGTCVWIVERSFTKMLAEEENEYRIPLIVHGSRIMLTEAEYEAHLEDTNQLDALDARCSRF